MPTITRVLLESDTPYHFGKRGVGLNATEVALPADSLFAAFCNVFALTKGAEALTALLARFPVYGGNAVPPPFRITSLMPTANGVDLLPMPLIRPKLTNSGVAARKQLKEIGWVSRAVFSRLTAGEEIGRDPDLVYGAGRQELPYTVQGGAVWVSRSELGQLGGERAILWTTDIRPRVTVDRMTAASTAFSSGSLHLSQNGSLKTSLYTLIRWETADAALQQDVLTVFRIMGEQGIGGERSYGYGSFRPSFADVEDDLGAPGGEYFTTLAPYLPQPGERAVFDSHSRYAIVLRRGWMSMPGHTNLRRPTIRMVDTGAVLRAPSGPVAVGSLADATPDVLRPERITVYRYGLAWPVSVASAAVT